MRYMFLIVIFVQLSLIKLLSQTPINPEDSLQSKVLVQSIKFDYNEIIKEIDSLESLLQQVIRQNVQNSGNAYKLNLLIQQKYSLLTLRLADSLSRAWRASDSAFTTKFIEQERKLSELHKEIIGLRKILSDTVHSLRIREYAILDSISDNYITIMESPYAEIERMQISFDSTIATLNDRIRKLERELFLSKQENDDLVLRIANLESLIMRLDSKNSTSFAVIVSALTRNTIEGYDQESGDFGLNLDFELGLLRYSIKNYSISAGIGYGVAPISGSQYGGFFIQLVSPSIYRDICLTLNIGSGITFGHSLYENDNLSKNMSLNMMIGFQSIFNKLSIVGGIRSHPFQQEYPITPKIGLRLQL